MDAGVGVLVYIRASRIDRWYSGKAHSFGGIT
jgi:hypothetical protein